MRLSSAFVGKPFPYKRNSLNLFRLVLAMLVLVAHSWYTVGAGHGPVIKGDNLGGWAVAGFFALSGFLITGSRLRHPAGDYILHRAARIFPAFLVCLVVMAFVLAPIAALIERHSLAGFFSTPTTPFEFVWGNAGLRMTHYDIAGTLANVPYPGAWNGSLWTLYYEFICYVVVWILGAMAVFRKWPVPTLGTLFVLAVVAYANPEIAARFGLNGEFGLLMRLLPFFLGGALAYFVISRFGVNEVIGIMSIVAAAGLIAVLPDWGGQLVSPLIAYGLLYLSTLIPQPTFVARHDISYGFYIYAWPVQQMLVLLGLASWGLPLYMVAAAVVTVGFAVLSWLFIERPALDLVRRRRSTHAFNAGLTPQVPS